MARVLGRSFDRASGKSALHMVSAWGSEQRLVLAQVSTDAKSNEITAVPKLLKILTLKGTIVTADALNWRAHHRRRDHRTGGRLCAGAQKAIRARSMTMWFCFLTIRRQSPLQLRIFPSCHQGIVAA